MGHTAAVLEELIDLYGRDLHGYLWRLLGGAEEAQDALQDTYLRALRGLPRLRQPDRARAWLYRIATHVAFTEIRRLRKKQQSLEPLDESLAGAQGPEATSDDVARLAEVRRAVEALPPKQRAALMMRKYQQMEYAEVGDALGCSPQAARAHVYQALRKVRARFAATEAERPKEAA